MPIKVYCTAVSREIKKADHVAVWALYDDKELLQAGLEAYSATTHNRACAWAAIRAVDALGSAALDNEKSDVDLFTDSSYVGRYFTNWEQYQHWQLNNFRTRNGGVVKNLDLLFLYWLVEKRTQRRVSGQFVPSALRNEEMGSFLATAKHIFTSVSGFDCDPGGQSLFDWPDVISAGLVDFDTSVALQNMGALYHA